MIQQLKELFNRIWIYFENFIFPINEPPTWANQAIQILKHPNPNPSELKALIRTYHPDKNPNIDNTICQELNKIYACACQLKSEHASTDTWEKLAHHLEDYYQLWASVNKAHQIIEQQKTTLHIYLGDKRRV